VKLVVQPEAEADIVDAALWYEGRAKLIRQQFLQTIEATLAAIGQYALLYVVSKQEVNVIVCFHCRRDPRRWQGRLR